jgi:hypothetical protein
MNRKHLTEGKKAVLSNNYSAILSKKLNEDKNSDQPRDEKGRFLPILETVSNNGDEKEENVARKIASERWKVSEWNVRIAQEIQKKAINIRWHSDNSSVEETVSTSDKDKVSDTKNAIDAR